MNSYASLCDDFGVSTYLHSKLEMPTGREPVLLSEFLTKQKVLNVLNSR